MKFNMHQVDIPLSKLHEMINNAESKVKKGKGFTSSVLMVQNLKGFKKKKKGMTRAKVGSWTPFLAQAAQLIRRVP